MLDVLMVIKTVGLDFDDRLRKECLSLKKQGMRVKILVQEEQNISRRGSTSYGIDYESCFVLLRKYAAYGQLVVPKTLELYCRMLWRIFRNRARVVWVHDIQMVGLIPVLYLLKTLGFFRKIVWDHHELICGNTAIYLLARMSDAIIQANRERAERFCNEAAMLRVPVTVLANFADKAFSEEPSKALPSHIAQWLAGKKYLLAQNGAARGRCFQQLVEAVCNHDDVKLVVIGCKPGTETSLEKLRLPPNVDLRDKVYFEGYIPQMEVFPYLDHALASVVLYSSQEGENFHLCASNRLYQSLARGVPVIVGANPPMRHFCDVTGAGIVLKDDGASVLGLTAAIGIMLKNSKQYAEYARQNREMFLWDQQDTLVRKLAMTP